MILTIVLVFAWIYDRIRRSPHGLALRAMHDSEDATRVVGVNNTLLKALMLLVSLRLAPLTAGSRAIILLGITALTVLGATAISCLVVRRRIDRLDLVAVLKSPD